MENKNQPAFPRIYEFGSKLNNDFENEPGVSKREYFAAKALQGLLACDYIGNTGIPESELARRAMLYADALLAELEK